VYTLQHELNANLRHSVGDVQELVGEQLSKRQENAGAQDFGVDAGNSVYVRRSHDGEIGHANLVSREGSCQEM
jgi:hypothetical protein